MIKNTNLRKIADMIHGVYPFFNLSGLISKFLLFFGLHFTHALLMQKSYHKSRWQHPMANSNAACATWGPISNMISFLQIHPKSITHFL